MLQVGDYVRLMADYQFLFPGIGRLPTGMIIRKGRYSFDVKMVTGEVIRAQLECELELITDETEWALVALAFG